MAFFTFIATAIIILGTWVVVMRAVGRDAWWLVAVALVVGGVLLAGLYTLAARRGRPRRS